MYKAHPTVFAGVQFRSRLEARWAAFFSLLDWDWQYEPVDLNGYVPDFFVRSKPATDAAPLLVEVKPALVEADYLAPYEKIRRSGWRGDAVVVGIGLLSSDCGQGAAIGNFVCDADYSGCTPSRAVVTDCSCFFGLSSILLGWRCRLCGETGKEVSGESDATMLRELFVHAQNFTQWRSPRRRLQGVRP